ncbi:MAG: retroviral-like aspartic protease [Elusimicrobia bacterium]|nr:retroviral-like aspartic protease [Elusimicrobiota bacterium]
MAIIQKEIELAGSKSKRKEVALFDSGATYSCIEKGVAEELGGIVSMLEPLKLGTAKEGEAVEAKGRIPLDFYFNGYRFSDEFMVIPGLSEKVIIGAKTLQSWRFKLDFENDEVIIDPRVTKIRLL